MFCDQLYSLQAAAPSGLTKNQKKKLKRKKKRASELEDANRPPTPSASQPEGSNTAAKQAAGPSAALHAAQALQQPQQAAYPDTPSAQEHSQWQDAEPALAPRQNGLGHHSDPLGARRMSVTMADADGDAGGIAATNAAAGGQQQQHAQEPEMNGHSTGHSNAAHNRAAAAQASEAAGDMRRSRRGDVSAFAPQPDISPPIADLPSNRTRADPVGWMPSNSCYIHTVP